MNISVLIVIISGYSSEGVCYQRVKQALNTAIPQKLLCREKEFSDVNCFLQRHLYKSVPGSLYISGAPGTGKTAVMTRVMDQIKVFHIMFNYFTHPIHHLYDET